MMPPSWCRRPFRRKRRKSALLGSCLVLLVLAFVVCGHHRRPLSQALLYRTKGVIKSPSSTRTRSLLEEQATFWRLLFGIIRNNDPQCKKPPEIVIPEKLDVAYEDDHVHHRPDVLWMDEPDIRRMSIAHQNFLNDLRTAKIDLVYEKGTRGIVTAASEFQVPMLLVQLRMLRSTESSLPVQVVFPSPTPQLTRICSNILPTLNATCIYQTDIFQSANADSFTLGSKMAGILFSTFDEILFLDIGAWPIAYPDHLFTYPPFTNDGLILWPDFWYASESPYFFSIAQIDNPPLLHTRPATESGELMYIKSQHSTSIMLASYYNYYGPKYYYPLQSQGAPGQGDKETFGSAATALKEPFYRIKTMVTALGRMDSSGQWLGSAMVQYDPIVDFQHHDSPTQSDPQHPAPLSSSMSLIRQSKPLFVHTNPGDFDPDTIFLSDGHDKVRSAIRDTDGNWVRAWDLTAEQSVKKFGFDLEKRFWETIHDVTCGKDLIKEPISDNKICEKVGKYMESVFARE